MNIAILISIALEFAFAGAACFNSPWWLIGFALTCTTTILLHCRQMNKFLKLAKSINESNKRIDASILKAKDLLIEMYNKAKED